MIFLEDFSIPSTNLYWEAMGLLNFPMTQQGHYTLMALLKMLKELDYHIFGYLLMEILVWVIWWRQRCIWLIKAN
jgi:hypothetical protein